MQAICPQILAPCPKFRLGYAAHNVGDGATEHALIGQAVINRHTILDVLLENTFNDPTLAEGIRSQGLVPETAWARRDPPVGFLFVQILILKTPTNLAMTKA